jgi:hypothetical protein
MVGPLQLVDNPEVHLMLGDRALLEANADKFVGGTLALPKEEFRTATLTTLDGNDYFIVMVQFQDTTIVVQDDGSGVW